jgi:hypothetical protein
MKESRDVEYMPRSKSLSGAIIKWLNLIKKDSLLSKYLDPIYTNVKESGWVKL